MLEFFKGTVTPKDWAFVATVLALTGLIGAAFYFFVYQRQLETLAAVELELETKTSELQGAIRMNENYPQLKALASTADDIVLQFEERLPEKREIPALLRQIDENGDAHNLDVELYALNTKIERDKEVIPYEINATGKFHDIVQFINELETDQRFLKVSNIEIGEQLLETGVSEATFHLSTFVFRQPEESDKVTNEPG